MSIYKKTALGLLSFVGKRYLYEYWQTIRSEPKNLPYILVCYKSFPLKGKNVFDVGANVGNYSRVFIELGASVVAFEPQKRCIEILKKRFKNDANFKLVTSACGAEKSTAVIHKPASHTIASMNKNWIESVKKTGRFGNESWDLEETINVTTLDEEIKLHFVPDYLKIDVEGYEVEVLRGLTIPIPLISFEITLPEFHDSTLKCLSQISRLGNYLYTILEEPCDFADWQWLTETQLKDKLSEMQKSGIQYSTDLFAKLQN
jgi:FkbM family methyltransferase